jgi:crossover junction endodeoxyribonuclease RusA
MFFELYTEYPPTVNNYYVKTQRGVFISEKGRKFRDSLIRDAMEQLGSMPSISGKVRVEIVAWAPDKRKRDLDNIKKPLFDAMTHAGLWDDDSLIDQDFTYRGDTVPGGRLYIKVSEAAPCIPAGMENLLDSGD